MIPKYILDKNQATLNTKYIPVKDKLEHYRLWLYYCLKLDLAKPYCDKVFLINKYKVATSEIDYELKYENKKYMEMKK